jgi:hypothetical protein
MMIPRVNILGVGVSAIDMEMALRAIDDTHPRVGPAHYRSPVQDASAGAGVPGGPPPALDLRAPMLQPSAMRLTTYSKYKGSWLDALNLEALLEGLSDFLPVLTSLQSVQQTELSLLGARRQLLSYRVQLHRALGGSWVRDLRLSQAPPGSR